AAVRLLRVPVLQQLIRLGDDGLGEFLGRYVSWALELYLQAKQSTGLFNPFLPFLSGPLAGLPFPSPAPAAPAAEPAGRGTPEELEQLRREVDALKRRLPKPRKRR